MELREALDKLFTPKYFDMLLKNIEKNKNSEQLKNIPECLFEDNSGDIRWHSMRDESFRKMPNQYLLVKTSIAIRHCLAQYIDLYNRAKVFNEDVLAWAILNEPKLDELE